MKVNHRSRSLVIQKEPPLPLGIMNYRRAYSILEGMIFDQKRMTPFFKVWLKYGTTLPGLLQEKIDPYKIEIY
jgi:hypothetical protein